MEQKKILVVDDDSVILQGLMLLLEHEGYAVEACIKADDIYKTVTKCKPNLILLDVMLVGHDGRHIARELKNNKKTKHIPIILISASHDVKKSVKEFGADEFVPKPFDINDLMDTIDHHIEKKEFVQA